MTEQEKAYFEILEKDRAENADTLEKPSMRGIKSSVVEKYSDHAHFIYELLQNADDAGADSVRFVLHKDKLVFAHNGKKHFSISNPDTEDEDSKNNKLGDINAITSIANSNKREASIGKFGVGFKAVFQYTSTPYIYDQNVFFGINRFIVPFRIDNDFEGRKEDETLFVFPFDHSERTADEAFTDISEKLRSLDYPLLFLPNLKEISIDISGFSEHIKYNYGKSIEQTEIFDATTIAELICLTQIDDNSSREDKLWLFSRIDNNGYKYSIGFFIDENGNLTKKQHPTYCFFPTKEVTGLKFIIHAPFLLTDSREGIRAGNQHNKEMIALLAALAADSLVYLREIGKINGKLLIDDNIFDIIPYDKSESAFNDVNDNNKISFLPFYTAIFEKMSNEELLPCKNEYAAKKNAYWAAVPEIAEVFPDEQLSELTGDKYAKWVFVSFGREDLSRRDKVLVDYIDSITHGWLNEDDLLKGTYKNVGISKSFIESQSFNQLYIFYKWISGTLYRTNLIKNKPIFLNKDMKAVSAYDEKDQPILFLPSDISESYTTIYPELFENEDTKNLLKQLDIKEPSLYDEIYNKILPKYKNIENNDKDDTASHFKKFFKYYKECPTEKKEKYIGFLKDFNFIKYRTAEDGVVNLGKASDLYFPTEELQLWFKAKQTTRFIELDEYKKLFGGNDENIFCDFLRCLGVNWEPCIYSREITYEEIHERFPDKGWNSTRPEERKWYETYLDGCEEVIQSILDSNNSALSIAVWKQLLKIISIKCNSWRNLESILSSRYQYFYQREKSENFKSSNIIDLRTKPWLLNVNGEFVSANELTLQNLSPEYDTNSDEAQELLRFLNIQIDNLTDEQVKKIKFAEAYEDIPPEIIRQFAEQYRAKIQHGEAVDTMENISDINTRSDINPIHPTLSRVVNEITKKIESGTTNEEDDVIDSDEDDYTKPIVDYSKKIEQAKKQNAIEIKKIVHLEKLTQKAKECEKYTFGWFKTLLELEALSGGEKNTNSREISISFGKVERERDTTRTLILKHPNRYIPQFMEDLADIPLELHLERQTPVKVEVEVVNVKSNTLRIKLKKGAQIDNVDLSLVTEAKIEAKSPVFLIEELRKAFNKLDLDDSFNMQKNLCRNIEFVFGPPGTGKTTHLVKNFILPVIRKEEEIDILVLTPTNKAADVLTRQIMKHYSGYKDWLVRFGTTNDNEIEQSGVYREKTFDIRTLQRNVTVTTIARFPYDYFLPEEGTRLHLNELKWDYIVIDEASMIPIANIVYPLYHKTPKKFIIAGDPFQIKPITSVDLWKDENIYTMVELNSFTKPTTIPHNYHVELLTTQYRSIPVIGEVFSNFAYGGVLKHNRINEDQRSLLISDKFDVKALNIIKFPVSKYESIYRSKKLQGTSNYQIYSALFTFEFIKWLSSLITAKQEDECFKIGIIAPYRAQADLIDKLFSSITVSKNIDIQVDTIHGFQGDECDIIIAVFNPPPSITENTEMFLNKRNIINVSISRARDYLFIIMPDDETENINNLKLVKKVETICKEQSSYIEKKSNDIEQIIFGSNSYLEDSSFTTSHQSVNVYREPEQRYEIRSEDSAVDVQIYQEAK
jgi:superfamily I DNA and/or RNA helicase